jgi:uncharacterized OB-fold protein
MQSPQRAKSKTITIENKNFAAAKCEKCGAIMYPASLLKEHVKRHRLQRLDYTRELRKLQQLMAHMRTG